METGRYQTPKVPLAERMCKLCNNGKVEAEFHLVMECSKLQNLRNELTKSDPSFTHHDIIDNFYNIFSCENDTYI